MHFWSQVSPGGHLKGFEACLQRSPALRTRARNSSVLNDHLKKAIGFSNKVDNKNDYLNPEMNFKLYYEGKSKIDFINDNFI